MKKTRYTDNVESRRYTTCTHVLLLSALYPIATTLQSFIIIILRKGPGDHPVHFGYTIMASDFQVQLTKILKDYADKEVAIIDKCIVKAGNYSRNDLRENSPRHTGDYAKGWRVKKSRGRNLIMVTVYNATDWQLTHLLENPHLIANQYGEWGMTGPDNGQHVHIKPAQERAERYLDDLLRKEL